MKTKTNQFMVVGPLALVDVSTAKYPTAVAVIDSIDLESVVDGNGRWSAGRPGGATTLYVSRWIGPRRQRRRVFLHRILLGLREGDGLLGDHANHDGLDNRRANIRIATQTQSNANLRTFAGHMRGVRFRGGRFHAHISLDNRQRYLGSFETEQEAAEAYDVAARERSGIFALLNGQVAA